MSRNEFTKSTKRQAWDRSGGACEADGALYGLSAGVRCGSDMTRTGAEYDHILACSNGGDDSLENCAAICKGCHTHKTRTLDTPRAAKTVRQRDKARNIKSSRGFPKPPKGYNPWTRRIEP